MKSDSKFLIPTKATLFGLDVRFRAIDKKIEEDKSKVQYKLLNIEKKRAFRVKKHEKSDTMNTTLSGHN